MRELAFCLIVSGLAACRFGEEIAEAPVDGAPAGIDGVADAGDTTPDGPDGNSSCTPGADGDRDNIADCDELSDGLPFTDPTRFNGLRAIIGDRPEVTGNCDNVDDYAKMDGRFDTPKAQQDVYAGWQFDTAADNYDDPSYGFAPAWPDPAPKERFSLRLRGSIHLPAGDHCFKVDIGATGTGLIDGKNACGQIYLGVGGLPTGPLAETGFGAASVAAATGCVTIPADGAYAFDIVFWYFDVLFHRAKLEVRQCAGAGCTPNQPVRATQLQSQR